jgi:hypothetical protein
VTARLLDLQKDPSALEVLCGRCSKPARVLLVERLDTLDGHFVWIACHNDARVVSIPGRELAIIARDATDRGLEPRYSFAWDSLHDAVADSDLRMELERDREFARRMLARIDAWQIVIKARCGGVAP